MSIIHRTSVRPTKLELLRTWLPGRPWYHGSAAPDLAKAGGFRLDDPEGEVGIEFMVVREAASGPYLIPLTYRGGPLEGAGHALVGTMEHGVLGRRWVYDGCHDPVLSAQLRALVEGRAQPQAQSVSDTPDREVGRSYAGEGPIGALGAPEDTAQSTEFAVAGGLALRLHRVLTPAGTDAPPQGAVGQVTGVWEQPDGTRARSLFATLRAA